MLPNNVHLMHYKSDRVLRLTASCVQTVVRLRYGYELPVADAVELARIHDVRSAVRIFGEKLRLLENIPRPTRFTLAATEAAFTGGIIPEEDLDRTIAVRRASIGTIPEHEQAGARREILVANLRELRRAWEQWAREYAHFIDRLAALLAEGERELKLLRLEPETAERAGTELEQVLLVALRKAGELEPFVQAAA